MTIGDIVRSKGGAVVTVPLDSDVAAAVALLHGHRIGAVVVMEGTRIAGVLSERDIVRGLHELGEEVLERAVSTCMSAPVVTVGLCDGIEAALAVMTERRFRHLPVVHDGALVAVVSIGDLVKARIDEARAEAAAMKEYIAG